MTDFADQARELLGDHAGEVVQIPLGDVAEAVIAICELRGFAWAAPRRQREYILDRCDAIARLLGLEDMLREISAQAARRGGWGQGPL